MEKTIYELKYNDWFNVRMTSDHEPMEEIEFDKAALQAILADIVLRGKDAAGSKNETDALWLWICTQIGLALQNSELAVELDNEPLDTVLSVVSRLKARPE